MFYLFDAALFLGFFALLLAFGLSVTSSRRPIEHALLFAPAGFLGVWATLFYLAGLLGFLQAMPFWAAAIVVLVGCLVWKRSNLITNAKRLGKALGATSTLEKTLLLYVAAIAALTFILSLVPPSGVDYDSLVYHLAVPAQWLRAGRVAQLPFDHHSYFPFVAEMLYALALGVRDAVFAKLFHWVMLVFGALALITLGKRAGGKTAGLWAAALFVSLPMAQSESTTAYVDLAFSTFAWSGIALFCEALFDVSDDTRTRRLHWIGSGLFCGLCLGSKYFGWLIFGFLGLWLLVTSARASETTGIGRERWMRLAWLAVPALAVGGFWYARNLLWTGNPVFPFAYAIFGGRGWTSAMAVAYDADQARFGFGKTPFDLLVLPFRLAMSPVSLGATLWPLPSSPPTDGVHSGFFDVTVADVLFAVFPGPVLLATGVPAFLARRKGELVGFLAWMFAFLWFFWAMTSQQIRYLFPALGILCVLSGWMLATRLPRFPLAMRIAGGCLALWMVFSPGVALWRAESNFAVLTGAQTPDDFLRRSFAGYEAMQWIGANTPASSRIAVYGEPRDFYLPRPYFWADDPHNNLVPYDSITTPAQLVAALKSLGATHVLYNRNAARNGGVFGPPQPLFDQTVSNGNLHPLFSARGFEVYELK
ncbi:hypothetical protein IAD21_02620 [Abditibacteriota bacterium]|nr:hypothetical protein IAD21_02620 [Abditibacteriota bacterium]